MSRTNRRDFLKYAAGAELSAIAAREILLQADARTLAQTDDVAAFSGGPGGIDVLGFADRLAISQSFKDAFVQKTPTTAQEIQHASVGGIPLTLREKRSDALATALMKFTLINQTGTFTISIPDLEGGSSVLSLMSAEDQVSGTGIVLLGYEPLNKEVQIGGFEAGDPAFSKKTVFQANSSLFGGSIFGFDVRSETGVGAASVLAGAGAQVGLPTGLVGTLPNQMVFAGHRHPFSGRFSKNGFIRDASLGGATPAKFARIISNNNWTLRRISVYTLTAPAGTGSDTYGVVNAAGTLQGTAVSLAVGVQENATALQVTNLTGGTVYYIATTARATTPALDVNVELEYTMNG